MNVLLISECSKNALFRTRRILDQFAERRGVRTWQTAITQEGLDTMRRLLRQSARKNTAVACHWVRGIDHTELLWIVGDARRFNESGAVPTHTTERNVLRKQDEDDWHSITLVRGASRMAALFHDFGKASLQFQRKLASTARIADPVRHEWVSLRLFQAFVGEEQVDDRDWLERLRLMADRREPGWEKRICRDGVDAMPTAPFAKLPPLARLIGWLIVSHHRLPCATNRISNAALDALWDELNADWTDRATDGAISDCWKWQYDLPDASAKWREAAARLASQLLARPLTFLRGTPADDPWLAHVGRMVLMLADHHYSSIKGDPNLGDPAYLAHANTDADGKPKQRLDEHLIGVADHARRIATDLTRLDRAFPRIARCMAFSQRGKDERFRWQDRAYDLAVSLRERSTRHGFFGLNMASTGCGKTLANARILYGLADPQRGARFTAALGLRTLTLQTGDAYQERLRLQSDDLAVLVGSSAVRALHELRTSSNAKRGSESADSLLGDGLQVRYEGALGSDGTLGAWIGKDPRVQQLLSAPVLVCTIDHLMDACESTRGGHQIAPMLRLMTADLVLDEPDDFDLNDLPALGRWQLVTHTLKPAHPKAIGTNILSRPRDQSSTDMVCSANSTSPQCDDIFLRVRCCLYRGSWSAPEIHQTTCRRLIDLGPDKR